MTIPEKSWSRFRDIFSDYVDKMKDGGGGGGGASAATPTSSSVADSSPGPSGGSHKSLDIAYTLGNSVLTNTYLLPFSFRK